MSDVIIGAIIAAAAAIIAACIGLLKREKSRKTVIKQRAKGGDITQVGIQVGVKEERGKHER